MKSLGEGVIKIDTHNDLLELIFYDNGEIYSYSLNGSTTIRLYQSQTRPESTTTTQLTSTTAITITSSSITTATPTSTTTKPGA